MRHNILSPRDGVTLPQHPGFFPLSVPDTRFRTDPEWSARCEQPPSYARLALTLLLFAITAGLILFAPLQQDKNFHGHSNVRWLLQPALWMLCLFCMLLLHRVSRRLVLLLPEAAIRSMLYVFLLFFAVQRVLTILPLHLSWMAVEGAGALLVCLWTTLA